ncbi:phosphate ABC transporter substrate-binding protein [Erysipelatoclostridium sp. An173]|uniref:phosphate ABC transporter substrate-binding protein n=1 Tax=Erysipelatoclostridium sp. An173 TaxID=1965571 RepID=UPI000B365BFC|nr:phosphate ABC transporter substrate-binding protein [Erysipelatoclostridium sp. An173]OUP79104.1 phosphate ABC transporter substrate-binding protein [Erysipelatoclostridium sp. An173]
MKKFGIVIVVLAVCFAMIGLSASADVETQKISLNGSTSMEKMVNAIKDGVVYDYPELSLEPQFTGSSAGIEAVINGKSDIGNSSRELKESELEQGLVSNVVAIDAIAIVTDTDNKTDNLTKEQLIDIYTGKIRNWKEVGGDDLPIVVIGREAGSGTRSAFEEILGLEEKCEYANEVNESGPIVAKVRSIPGAIGYVSLDVVDDSIKTLAIDGVYATDEAIIDGSYSLQRPFVMATKGTIEEQSEQVQNLFKYIYSEDGRKIIESVGLIPVDPAS